MQISKVQLHQFPKLSEALKSIQKDPKEIFIEGHPDAFCLLDRLPQDGLAIVGTRSPTPRSQFLTRKAVSELQGSFLIIVSGLAEGIDTYAHQAALQNGLPTIAIIANSLEYTYPQFNASLRQQIVKNGGLILTEHPPQTPSYRSDFLHRNRLIAAWSKATLVIEAPHRSGALNTASWCRQLDHHLYALPCFPGDEDYAGNQRLLDPGHALPFWGTHSLGSTWIEMCTPKKQRTKTKSFKFTYKNPTSLKANTHSSDLDDLLREIQRLSHHSGGATIQAILDWSVTLHWSPKRALNATNQLLKKGLVVQNQNWISLR